MWFSLWKDLPEDYLSQIYDEIAGNEIKMKAIASNNPANKVNKAGNCTDHQQIVDYRSIISKCEVMVDAIISSIEREEASVAVQHGNGGSFIDGPTVDGIGQPRSFAVHLGNTFWPRPPHVQSIQLWIQISPTISVKNRHDICDVWWCFINSGSKVLQSSALLSNGMEARNWN